MNSKQENPDALERAPEKLDNHYDYNNEINSTKNLNNKASIKTESFDNDASQQPKTNPSEVNKFINILMNFVTPALKDFENPGSLQLSMLDRSGSFSSQRFNLNDPKGISDVAIACSDVGSNCYIEARTIRLDAPRNVGRGKKEDTALVFALVVDNDRDRDMAGSFILSPSLKVETSPGNSQDWIFFEKAVSVQVGESLGKSLKLVAGGDHCTGVVTQCYRLAGTINYVNETKRARGRVDSATKILSVGRAYSVDEIVQALNNSEKNNKNVQPDVSRKIQTDNIEELLKRCGNQRNTIENELNCQSAQDRSTKFHGIIAKLKKMGFSSPEVIVLLNHYPKALWHEKYKGRIESEVERSFKKIQLDNSSLCEERVSKKFSKPIIIISGGGLAEEADQAEVILAQSNLDLYQRGGEIVRPCVLEAAKFGGFVTKNIFLMKVSEASLTDDLSRVIDFQKYCSRKKDYTSINPPTFISKTIQSRQGRLSLPTIAGVVSTPIIKQGGFIVSEEGYDPETRLFLAALPNLPDIPPNPTREDALNALKLIDDLLAEFPFCDEASKSVGRSAIITPVCRSRVPTVPMHAIAAPAPGTGKSFLVDCAALIATGEKCPVTAVPNSADEIEKRIDGSLLDGAPIICLDNVNGELSGDKLCQAIERPVVEVRRLGASDKQRVENKACVFSTGNNILLRGDLSRRTIIARLDASVERPEQRQFKKRPDKMIMASRGKYIVSCSTIVRAYEIAGSPNVLSPLASFEDWSNTIRSALVWLGCADPLETMRTIQKDDPENQTRQLVFTVLHEFFLERPVTVKEMITLAQETYNAGLDDDSGHTTIRKLRNPELADALSSICGRSRDASPDVVGKWFRDNKGRITDGLQLLSISHSKGAKWYVRRLHSEGGDTGGSGGMF